MGFKERIEKSERAIDAFVEWAKENGLNYAFIGYEKLISSSEFKNKLKDMDDITAKRIRYFPDMILLNKKAWLLEIKNSKTIEKDAYDTYIDLYSLGWNVGIVFFDEDENILRFTNIYSLEFKLPRINLPVIGKYWIAPRELSDNDYKKWKNEHPEASGTTYAIIDFENIEFKILSRIAKVQQRIF